VNSDAYHSILSAVDFQHYFEARSAISIRLSFMGTAMLDPKWRESF